MNKSPSVPGFLTKTHEIFTSPQYQDICCWGPNGNTINVKKIEQFSKEILPKYFKHSNYQSFVRQLNMYDFHKIVQDPNNGEFQHQYFVKDRPDLLVNIKRKANNRTAESLKKLSKSSSSSTLPPANSQHHNMNNNIVHHMVGKDNGPRIEEVDEYDDNIANLLPDELLVETDTVLTELDQQRLMHDEFVQKMETRMEKLEHENELLKSLVKESNKKTMIMQERMTKVMKTIYSVFAANPHMGQALLSRMPSLAIEAGPSFSSPLAMITDGCSNGTSGSTDVTLRRLPSYDPYNSYNSSVNNNTYVYSGLNNPLAGTEIAAASRGTSFDLAAASVTAPYMGPRDRTFFGSGPATINSSAPVESDRVTLLTDDSPVPSPSKQQNGSTSNKNGLKRPQDSMLNSTDIKSNASTVDTVGPPLKLPRIDETEVHNTEPIVTSPVPSATNTGNHNNIANEDLLGPTLAPEQLAQIEPLTRDFIDLLNRNQRTTLTRLNSLEQTLALLLEDIEDDGFLSKLQADSVAPPAVQQQNEDNKNYSTNRVHSST